MIYANVGGIRDLLKQDLALEFCRKQNKYIIILTETHIKHDQILYVRNNWLGPIFLLEVVTQKDWLPRFIRALKVSLRLTLIQKRDLCPSRLLYLITDLYFCAPSRHNTREQLVRERFFDRLQNYMKNKCEGNENKIIFGDFNITMDKMDRDGGNKTQRL